MSKTYQEGKEAARMEAIEFQACFGEYPVSFSYGELADRQAHFEKLGKRFGLLREFRENGII